jgi:DNA polymerase III subunit alpha
MTALMNSSIEKSSTLNYLIKECRNLDLNVLPPHINESEVEFSVKDESIRFGLAAIKNVRRKAGKSIIEARARIGAFTSMSQFCTLVDSNLVSTQTTESLSKSGAFEMECLGE